MAWTTPAQATTNQVVTAAFWNAQIPDNFDAAFPDGVTAVDFDPVWQTDGSGFAVSDDDGAAYRVGSLVFAWARARVSTAGSGVYYAELDVATTALPSTTHVIGQVFVEDVTAASNMRSGVVLLASGSPQEFRFYVDGGAVSATYPFTMATNDRISFWVCYPAV